MEKTQKSFSYIERAKIADESNERIKALKPMPRNQGRSSVPTPNQTGYANVPLRTQVRRTSTSFEFKAGGR